MKCADHSKATSYVFQLPLAFTAGEKTAEGEINSMPKDVAVTQIALVTVKKEKGKGEDHLEQRIGGQP